MEWKKRSLRDLAWITCGDEEDRITLHDPLICALQRRALSVRQALEETSTAAICHRKNGELPPRKTPHHLQPLRREILPAGSWWRRGLLRIGKVPNPFPRPLRDSRW